MMEHSLTDLIGSMIIKRAEKLLSAITSILSRNLDISAPVDSDSGEFCARRAEVVQTWYSGVHYGLTCLTDHIHLNPHGIHIDIVELCPKPHSSYQPL